MANDAVTDVVENDWMNTYLPVELKQWVRVRAAGEGKSMSAWVADLIQRERDRVEPT